MSAVSRPVKCGVGLLWGLVMAAGCATSTTERLHLAPLQTVDHVDLPRYLGTWYEIANFPQSFQRGCTATTATYTLRPDGEIDVLNRCRQGSLDGKEKSALGRARVVDRQTNAKLEVSFFRPFWGDYWIINLADDYSYAVVGHPDRDYLWILARTATIDEATYQSIVARLQTQGYETFRLVRTLQPASATPSVAPSEPRSSVDAR
jgi:apolipoprotein D and lipocalin family protein